MKFFSCLNLGIALILSASGTVANGAILFESLVNLNFNAIDGTLANINNVFALELGDAGTTSARIAANGTDQNSNFILDTGDTTRVVGHALVESVKVGAGGLGGQIALSSLAPARELTAVLRNFDGTIQGGIVGLTPATFNVFSSGFIDLYLDSAPVLPFDSGDLANSVNDTLVATFQLVSGQTSFIAALPDTSFTNITAILTFNNSGFFGLPSGADPTGPFEFLMTSVVSADRTNNASPFAGISGGVNGSVDIGTGFTPGNGFDVISNIDGNAQFATVPEPLSLVCWIGLGFVGVVAGRRRMRS